MTSEEPISTTGQGGAEGNANPIYYCLSKLTLEDNIEDYLYNFETTATTTRWPPAQWVTILGPNLTEPAQVVLKTIPAQEATGYQQVKATILDRYEVTEDTQRQHFWGLQYRPGDHTKALIAEVKEYATCWLKPQTPRARVIVVKVVLEQIFQSIPNLVHAWLMQSGPSFLSQGSPSLIWRTTFWYSGPCDPRLLYYKELWGKVE